MTKKIVLAGGCFWCTEGIFQRIPGVVSVESGYAGGHVPNPTYEQVAMGNTGHAECNQIEYDPEKIELSRLLELFFLLHDPTTLDRQGYDIGTEYRSAIFFTEPDQELVIQEAIKKSQDEYNDPIVTEVKPLDIFWKAEDYHQNYYNNNSDKPYCRIVINPKLAKLQKILGES